MRIIATSDWHLGNLFHGNDRLPEHRHFLEWLKNQIKELQPDALLIAGDVFDNGNPSAAAQSLYYEFLADATEACPEMQVVITAGNHDSASRLEAPRPLLTRHKVEIRGNVTRTWISDDGKGHWETNYADLMIPLKDQEGQEVIVLAVPYLRSDMVQCANYSEGVTKFLHNLTDKARETYPGRKLIMMAHMYAKGAEIATKEPSEKIVIGGQEEVNMEGWTNHPDYMTCGHIHKRQHIWNTDWARYSGSVLPMSFAEKDYVHGVDLVTIAPDHKIKTELLQYVPQHALRILPEDDAELTIKKLEKLIRQELPEREEGALGDDFVYVTLKVTLDKVSGDDIKALETLVAEKNAVLCKIQKIVPSIDLSTITGSTRISSIDDILNRDPMETLKEAFVVKHRGKEISPDQENLLREMLTGIKEEYND